MASVSHDSWSNPIVPGLTVEEQRQLHAEDTAALTSISMILSAVIAGGVVIAIAAVIYTSLVRF